VRILCQRGPRIERENQAVVEVKENDRAIFKLGTDDSFGVEAQSFAVKGERLFQIVHAERDDLDPRFHMSVPRA